MANLKKHAGEDVVFTGYLRARSLAELFSNAYLYVQPSTLEGMPVAVLEALSYGRCILASDILGNREALGKCGYAFEVGNVDDLRQEMSMLLHNPELVMAQYIIGRDYVRRKHNWDSATDQFQRLYERLLPAADVRSKFKQSTTASSTAHQSGGWHST